MPPQTRPGGQNSPPEQRPTPGFSAIITLHAGSPTNLWASQLGQSTPNLILSTLTRGSLGKTVRPSGWAPLALQWHPAEDLCARRAWAAAGEEYLFALRTLQPLSRDARRRPHAVPAARQPGPQFHTYIRRVHWARAVASNSPLSRASPRSSSSRQKITFARKGRRRSRSGGRLFAASMPRPLSHPYSVDGPPPVHRACVRGSCTS